MRTRLMVVLALTLLAAALAGCSAQKPTASGSGSTLPPDSATATPPSSGPAAGMQLAPGLYDQPDGTVIAVGTLEHQDLEGGFWAVVDGTAAEGAAGRTVAVIANAEQFAKATAASKGRGVIVTGKRLDGASIRMAGPEIEATNIQAATDTYSPAQ